MITDAITLRLIYGALKKFEANQGDVIDIMIEGHSNESNVPKSVNFKNLEQLHAEVIKYSNVDWSLLECNTMYFFKLKKFNTKIQSSLMNIVHFDGAEYSTDSKNINHANFIILNDTYLRASNEVYTKWLDIQVSEYIKNQRNYIDCGYIQIYFEEDVQRLKELYKKYKK